MIIKMLIGNQLIVRIGPCIKCYLFFFSLSRFGPCPYYNSSDPFLGCDPSVEKYWPTPFRSESFDKYISQQWKSEYKLE